MSVTNLTITIAGTNYNILNGSFKLSSKIDERSTCDFIVRDDNSAFTYQKGQQVTVSDTIKGTIFVGFVNTSQITKAPGTNTLRYHTVSCIDNHFLADKRTTNKTYTGQYAGVIVAGMINDVLALEGVTANYAIREDNTQTEFGQGTLSGVAATSNLGGDLELASAGSTVSLSENTTSAFGNGTLTNMTASNNTIGPSATTAMKIQATQSVQGTTNSYTYMKFWGGSITVVSGRYLTYDIWIASTSPEAKIGIDLIFTDGTALRDTAVSNNGLWFDAQNKSPHPNTDLKGLAVDQLYHRSFLMDNFVGKTIAYAMIAIEGDSSGTYTGYVKNVTLKDSGGSTINTLFSGSLNVNPPQQMLKTGYGTTSVTTVNTYDCSTANRVSPSYSIDAAKILKSSFISYKTSLPTGYGFNLSYSIDGGNSYTPITNNNAALPNLPAGISVTSKNIQFLQSFTQGSGADPTQQPQLTSLQAVLYPSYASTKSDVNAEFTTNGQWNTSGTSFNNTQAPSNILAPFGAVRSWDNGDLSSQTLFGGGATGPNTATTCYQFVDSKQFRLQLHQSTEARSRMDFAGQWADFQMEFDAAIDNGNMKVGCFYRGSGNNYDGTYAYAVEVTATTIKLYKGSNNSGATANFAPTQVGSTATVSLSSAANHRIKLIISGSSHQIYFDDTLAVSATDSTYTSAGYVGFRISNTDVSNGYIGTFDNFGISPTGLGGTWTSQSISLSGAGTYGGSVIQWNDVSTDPTQVNNIVQSSTDGGSTWQTLTNGGSIPSLTLGQSLSGVSVKFKITFSANSSTVLPQMQYLTAYILGQFSSSGTRISPALSLATALIAGSTVVNWSAVTPPNTSVAVATAPDGTTWTNVSNGGSIAGINSQPLATLDTFGVNSSANYTSSNRTGGATGTWVWDTANSRVTVSGGTSALLLYSPLWYNTGYLKKKQIIINHTQVVGGADLPSFPVLVSMTDPDLRTIANGGYVQSNNGYDIIFVIGTENGILYHEIKKYVPTTGEIEMYVSVTTVSHTVDTVIYMYFDNVAISTSQENINGVWDANYKTVYHLKEATGTNPADSTSNANNTVQHNSPVQTPGQIDGSLSFDGLAQYLSIAGAAANITGDKTIEILVNISSYVLDALGTFPRILINNIDGTNVYQLALGTGGIIIFAVNDSSGQNIISNQTSATGVWYYLCGTYTASTHTVTLDINGVSVANNVSESLGLGSTGFNIGRRTDGSGYYMGGINELRISNTVRSAGWRITSFNSQMSPSSFFSVGAIQSQSTLSVKDIDIVVDMDQADCAGIVWRQTDASNFYELDIFDSASNAGSTNVLKLYKVVANTKTQLGSNTAISFTRGTPYRARVTMIGTSITVYFDGTSVLSTTDSALAGPGKAGLIEVSGSAHFYNLRLQPQGDNLSGKNAYTKVTLTSTDPTATPQLTDLVLAALHPNITAGSLIPTASYLYAYISSNMDDLSKKSNTYWKIDKSLNMIFATYQSVPAPWVLTDKDILVDGLQVTNNGDLYRNRQVITGVIATGTDSETKIGDGKTRSWTLGGILVAAPTIYLNNQLQTVGIKGIDTGKNFYWTPNSAVIDQDSSGTLLQQTDQLSFPNYKYQYSANITVDNTGQFPGTVSQAQFAALSGGTGIVEEVTDVSSQALDVPSGIAMANNLLQRNGVIGRTIQFKTLRSGLDIGQYLPIFNPETSMNDAEVLITQVDVTQKTTIDVGSGNPTQMYFNDITAVESVNSGSWQKLLASAVN